HLLVLPSFPTRRSSDLYLSLLTIRRRPVLCGLARGPFPTVHAMHENFEHCLAIPSHDQGRVERTGIATNLPSGNMMFSAPTAKGDRKSTRLNSSHDQIS